MAKRMKMGELLEQTEARMYVYSFLRGVYLKEPTMDSIHVLMNGALEGISDISEMNKGARIIKEACKGIKDEKRLEDLHVEFARLFIGPGKMLAPPYESVAKGGRIMQEPAIEVRKIYQKEGLAVKRLYSEPDDHIGAEFEFMFYLCKKCRDLHADSKDEEASKVLEKQRTFLNAHILSWVPEFCDKIIESTNEAFYKGMAIFTKGFIEEDARVLEEACEI